MYIASASTTVKFHEFSNTNAIYHYQPGTKVEGPIRSISWSKDGNWLAIVPHSGQAEIITIKSQLKLVHTVKDISEPSCASFQNLTKKHLAIGTKSGQVLIYDIKSRTVKKRFPRSSSVITHVGFTAKDTHCVAGCSNGEVFVYNNVANNISCALKVPKSNSLTTLKTHVQKRHLLLGGSNEGVVVVWDTNTNKSKFCVDAHNAPVTCAAFSPINSSLVISTGLDRQFCIYDVESRERIACVGVENNLTAVDFVDDATYFAMASQNGRIHVYDSRHLQQPAYTFEAHQSTIKHLAFQNNSDDGLTGCNTSSLGSLIGEDIRTTNSNNEGVKKNTSDFFGYLGQGPSGIDTCDGEKQNSVSIDGKDSFIAALNLDINTTVGSLKQNESQKDEVVPTGSAANFLSSHHFTPNVTKNIPDRLVISDTKCVKQTTSTPKLFSQNFLNSISPIISSSHTQVPNVTVGDVQSATKAIIQTEIKSALQEIKTEMTYQLMHSSQQIRRMVLDLHMAMVKEFIKVENYCNGIKDEIKSESRTPNENYLIEENMNLRKKIQMLESQIANLTAGARGDDNGNK